MRPRALLLLAGVLGCTAAPAAASTIAYQCGNEICGIDPAGGPSRPLTSGGTAAAPNRFGTISRDGRLVSWENGSTIYTSPTASMTRAPVPGGDQAGLALRMSPAGNAWLWHQTVPPSDYTYLLSGAQPAAPVAVNAETSGWLGTTPLGAYRVQDKDPSTPPSQVCALDTSPARCPRLVLSDPTRLLSFPDGSPDGGSIVAVAEPETGSTQTFGGAIALYSATTGALVRDLTTGTSDSIPAFSPDGTQVAFQRDGGVWVVPIAGGNPRRVATGGNPSWGDGGPAPQATITAVGCRRRAKSCVLRGTATGAARVDVSVLRHRGKTCEAWTGTRWAKSPCSAGRRVRARLASGRWTLTLKGLRAGTLTVSARAAGSTGALQRSPARRAVRVR